jgi:hypothetical protein
MIRATILAAALAFTLGSASAAPVFSHANTIARSEMVTDVKIICGQEGYCFHRGRRPVARWVYGDGNFDTSYTGPGNYGRPGHHWVWSPFWGY